MHFGVFELLWFPFGFVAVIAACSLVFMSRYRHYMQGIRDRRARSACYDMALTLSAIVGGPVQVRITSVVSDESAVLIGYYRSETAVEDSSASDKERSTLLAWLPDGESLALATLNRWSADNCQILMYLNATEKILQFQGRALGDTVELALVPTP
ncbi:MAG: hypothetical protein HKL81_01690 [Acidimicrobiaceae bacterium]|nr:hypothetical protein [Acidimicrobiaceae bacterium]